MGEEVFAAVRGAVVDGRYADLEQWVEPLAATAVDALPRLQQALNMLAFHNQLGVMTAVMEAAWPQVQAAAGIFPAARNEFAVRATEHLIYRYLAETAVPQADDPALTAALNRYFPIEAAGLARYFAFLRGEETASLTLADFDFEGGAGGTAAQNSDTLLIMFMGRARGAWGVPYCVGALLRRELPTYLAARRTGQLAPRQSVTDLMRGGRPFPSPPAPEYHPLNPDPETLGVYLSQLLHFARPRPYLAGGLLLLLPDWVRFLQEEGLLEAAAAAETQAALAEMRGEWREFWREKEDDPGLYGRAPWQKE